MRTVHRILDERGLLNGRRYPAERRELAKARKQTFQDPPTRRNRVWQTDFSEFETRAGGTWQLGGVVDYAAKFASPARSRRPRPGARPSPHWKPPASAPARFSAAR